MGAAVLPLSRCLEGIAAAHQAIEALPAHACTNDALRAGYLRLAKEYGELQSLLNSRLFFRELEQAALTAALQYDAYTDSH